MAFDQMTITTYENWVEEDTQNSIRGITPTAEKLEKVADERRQELQQRTERLSDFPYSVVVETSFAEYDFANRWCWQNFGPSHGECEQQSSAYPACPLVLATEDQGPHLYGLSIQAHQKIAPHHHQGCWLVYWYGKTDYDYGFCEYHFANESSRDQFLAAVPTFGWGESYASE
jgi:hypothetical protein